MKSKPDSDTQSAPVGDPEVAVTILVTGTTIGDVIFAKGHKLRLPKSKADILASLTPPAARIDGI